MSLLLDALKRAEQEKHARNGDAPAELAAEPARAPVPSSDGLELQPIAPAAPPSKSAQQSAAQAVFQAKAAAAANEPRSRSMLVGTAVGAILILVIAAGAYVWHTIRTLAPDTVASVRPRPVAAPVPPPAGAPPAAATVKEPASAMGPLAEPTSVVAPTEEASAGPGAAASLDASAAPAPAGPPRSQASQPAPARLVEEVLRESAERPAPSPLRLERSPEPPRIPRDIAAGYEALVRGELAPARRSYEAALAADPASVDAHLGMATVEAHSGHRAAAAGHYRRALELDPRNATALAGLAALADHSRPEALEIQLREDLARHPDSAALRFALGNLYAAQARWTEAQAEFFEAYQLDPRMPEVLYNLAVSLDHLGQPRLAVEFYRRALDASKGQTTQFDPAPVARRLAELRP